MTDEVGGYDVARVRTWFPAVLEGGAAHFDGPGGSQVPQQVADAVAATLVRPMANRGVVTTAERNAEAAVIAGREAMADLLGASPDGIVFGRSMTQNTYDLARALAKDWGPGDEVVVTRLDHDANIRPWVQAAEAVGATVRWAAFDRQSAELPTWAVTDLLHERTRLVAVTGASNLLGTRPDVPAIAAAAHSVGALVHLDAVHLAPHAPIDLPSLGVDFVACSPYKFFGPHHGVLAAAPAVLEAIRPDKLLPSTDRVPERFELGTLPYELLAGTAAAVDVIADLVPGKGSRRERILASMAAAEAYEDTLWHRMVDGLDAIPGVVRYGRPERHTPTVLFSVTGVDSRAVYEHLATRGVNAPAGSFYALEASRWLGLRDDGAVRAGLAPYTDDSDVDRLLEAVAEVAARA